MLKILSRIIFWFTGWKAIGTFDYPKKCVVIAAPHTSNWDFFIGSCYGYISGIKAKYLIKSSYFKPIIRTFFSWHGGIPVYRNSKNDLVDQIVQKFNSSESFILGIAPEGTRSKTGKLLDFKKGPFHLAKNTKTTIVPIGLLGAFSAKKKKDWRLSPGRLSIKFGEPITYKEFKDMSIEELSGLVKKKINILINDAEI